jgi:hypothetical protein
VQENLVANPVMKFLEQEERHDRIEKTESENRQEAGDEEEFGEERRETVKQSTQHGRSA